MIQSFRHWMHEFRRGLRRLITRAIRKSVYDIAFLELVRQPNFLRYAKIRMALLDRYTELFPGAQECTSRFEVLDVGIRVSKEAGIKGLWLEFGVWKGVSINYLADRAGHAVYGFDSFEGLPEDWDQGATKDSVVHGGDFRVHQIPRVRKNVVLMKGWFDRTLPAFLREHPDIPVQFVHIDSDLYSSAKTVLDELGGRLQAGAVLVFDEFYNYPNWEQDEYRAYQEFARARGLQCRYLAYNSHGEQVALQIL